MTQIAADNAQAVGVDELELTAITHFRLSEEQIGRVHYAMHARQLTFREAAVQCGFVTESEWSEAMARVLRAEQSKGEGLVETALRRQVQNRKVVVRPDLPRVKPGPRLVVLQDPFGAHSERIRGLRTELLLVSERTREASVLAVLSPTQGEGRSLLASELAIAFAQLGRRTLLVDADLRKPTVHNLFGANNARGLTQALTSQETPQLLGVEGVPELSLLTSGNIGPNPLELLSDKRFERLLGDWRRAFDFILVDTPPVSHFTDALLIASMAGNVLVLSRAAVTPYGEMKEMLQRLGNTQARILGAVINHF
jgi:protein-tyrosine kinase